MVVEQLVLNFFPLDKNENGNMRWCTTNLLPTDMNQLGAENTRATSSSAQVEVVNPQLQKTKVEKEDFDFALGYDLCKAAMTGDIESAKALIDQRADPNYQDPKAKYSVLHCAIGNGYAEVAKFLVEVGANVDVVNATGRSPLHFAARIGNKSCSRVLLEGGCHVNLQDQRGVTALHIASRLGHINLAHHLMNHGADYHILNDEGKTSLDLAVEYIKSCYH
jgi:ankyrin repeat protein